MLSLPFRLVISNQGFSLFFQMKISTSFAECFYGCYRLDTLEKCGPIIASEGSKKVYKIVWKLIISRENCRLLTCFP